VSRSSQKELLVSHSAGRGSPNRTLEKGLLLLGLFDMDHPDWSLRELRERSGFSKTTTLRLIKTLESLEYLACDPRTGRYHLGSSILKAVYVGLSHSELVRTARPFLQGLAEETTESVSLTVWTDRGPLLVDMVLTPRMFKPQIWLGMLLPGLGSANARIHVAFGSQSIRDGMLATPQATRTPLTTTDPERLRDELVKVRREGIAFERQEWDLSMGAVAAPVLGPDGSARAALAVVLPIERCGQAEILTYMVAVKQAARNLSRQLGYQGDFPPPLPEGPAAD
jgi:DNA-binding IclR family transcriptional regulator